MNTHKTQEMLQPFGQANLKPLFLIKEVMVEESRPVGEGKKHLRLVVNKEGRTITCIAFNLGEFAQKTKPGTSVDIVFELDINEFRGVQSLQFLVKDLNICTINEAN